MASLPHPPDSKHVMNFELWIDIYVYTQSNNYQCVSPALHKSFLRLFSEHTNTLLYPKCGHLSRLSYLHTHLYSSQVWLPKNTLTVLPASRFSPTIVTLVPPDSGPRPGVRASIEGVCRKQNIINILFDTSQKCRLQCVCLISYLIIGEPCTLSKAELTVVQLRSFMTQRTKNFYL